VKYAWIDAQRRDDPLPDMCEVLDVSISGYRAWRRGGTPDRTRLSDPQAVTLIRSIHAEFKAAYGSRRMHRELQGRGQRIGLRRVERLMHDHGVRARHKRRFKATTDSRHSLPVAPNLLARNFAPEAPNRVWTSDITYIQTGEGRLYLAIVLADGAPGPGQGRCKGGPGSRSPSAARDRVRSRAKPLPLMRAEGLVQIGEKAGR
jgi:hypothetical protein